MSEALLFPNLAPAERLLRCASQAALDEAVVKVLRAARKLLYAAEVAELLHCADGRSVQRSLARAVRRGHAIQRQAGPLCLYEATTP